ncbi:hypothetical protein KHA80_01180 [Anaerobacillus sp. HL2]|nr:hypothetical protein KHA80_01180 [Anaerobacillus sp. HL2]
MKKLFYNGAVVTGKRGIKGYIIVSNGKIEEVGSNYRFSEADIHIES